MEKMTKKNSPVMMTLDLFVKLGNILDDCFFLKLGENMYISPKTHSEKVYGNVLCNLTSGYVRAIEAFFDEVPECFYTDITTTKNWLKGLTELIPNDDIKEDAKKYFVESSSSKEEVIEYSRGIENSFFPTDKELKWLCLGNDEWLVNEIFEEKRIIEIPISRLSGGDEKNLLTISKYILPMVTVKTADKCFITCPGYGADETVIEILVLYDFTHFKLMSSYIAVTLLWEICDDN